MPSTPDVGDSVNVLILADRRVTIEDLSEQLKISMGTAYKIMHDDHVFFKVNGCWVSQG